jgi:hypothetical protein
VALLIRHWHGGGRFTRGGTLLEGGLHVSALWVQALGAMLLARRTGRLDLEYFKYGQWRALRARVALHDQKFEHMLRSL